MKRFLFYVLAFSWLLSCKETEEDGQPAAPVYSGKAKLTVSHVVGADALELDTKWYVNASQDSFRVSKFRYYMSNVVLKTATGTWKVPESYYLLDEAVPASKSFVLQGLPAAEFTGIEFLIGVDSARNTSGAQSGALDPQNDMFWSWSTGYIFSKFEGYYMNNGEKGFSLHIGGFKEPYNCIRKVSLSFNGKKLNTASLQELKLKCDLAEIFKNPEPISLKQINDIHSLNNSAVKVATNYADMISFEDIQ